MRQIFITIRIRIILLIAFASLCLAVLGGTGLWGMRNSYQSLKAINQERVLKLQQLRAITEALSGTMRSAILKMDEGELTGQEGIALMVNARNTINANWTLFKDGPASPDEKQLSFRCDTLLLASDEAIATTISALDYMKNQSGGLLSNQLGMLSSSLAPSIEPVLPMLDSLVLHQIQASQQLFLITSKHSLFVCILFIILFVLGIVVTLSIGIVVYRQITIQLKSILTVLNAFAEGNLYVRIQNPSTDELGQIASASNRMADSIQNMVVSIRQAVYSLASTSEELSVVSLQVNANTLDASEKSRVSASSVTEATNQIEHIASSTKRLSQTAMQLTVQSNQILKEVENVSTQCKAEETLAQEAFLRTDEILRHIENLEKTSNEISAITHLIAKIARQTNLLALNATIEAANAGETGRGFTVVAKEVKDLAQQTSNAVGVIQNHIERLNSRTRDTVQYTRDIIERIQSIHGSSSEITNSIHIVLATMQRSMELTNHSKHATDEIAKSVIDGYHTLEVISENANGSRSAMIRCDRGVEQVQETAKHLSKMATELTHLVEKFKT